MAGPSVVSGVGRAVVFATGMHTEFGKIAHLTQTASKGVSPLRMESVRLSHIIALFALTLGVLDIGADLDQCGLFLRAALAFSTRTRCSVSSSTASSWPVCTASRASACNAISFGHFEADFGYHLDFGTERTVDRTVVGDLQQACAFLVAQIAFERDLADDFVDLAFLCFTVRAVLRMDFTMRKPHPYARER
ncbi:MAG: hypothetical protein L0Y38_00470 [Methylococcaceae bacterium]|nr:hypothetical protein [Methylococcaceae bacterium]